MIKRFLRGFVILMVALAIGFAFGCYGLGQIFKPAVAATGSDPNKPATESPSQVQSNLPDVTEQEPEPAPDITIGAPSDPNDRTNRRRSDRRDRTQEQQVEPDIAPEPVEPQAEVSTPPEVQDRPAASTTRYSLQAGRFSDEEYAKSTAEQIANMGYPARVQSQGKGASKEYKVLVGSYPTEKSARNQAEKLRQDGFDAFISKEQR